MAVTLSVNKSNRDTSAGSEGILKEINGVNGIPISIAPGFPDLDDQFNQAGITYIRLHDGFGIGDIDNYFQANRLNNQNQLIPNVPTNSQTKAKTFIADYANRRTIFPNAAAGMRSNDVDLAFKNANYAMTDAYLKRIMDNNPDVNPGNIQRKIMFRIGRTLDGGYEVPQDSDIYATLISTLVDRYALNYSQTGLPRKVDYWEIWNEPDLTFFWNNNNATVFYAFYAKVAKMIKAVDPSVKVGGCGVATGYNPGGAYLDGLLEYCQKNDTPIDFLSWHYYGSSTADPQNIMDIGDSIQSTLNKYGFGDIESICTEWNSSPFATTNTFTKVQSAKNAAYIASTFAYMQYCKVDKAYYYRGDGSSFGLFNDNVNPANTAYKSFCTYSAQAFSLYARMFETPFILSQDKNFGTGMTILACENQAGNKLNILVANYKVESYFVNGSSAPTETSLYQQYYLDTNRTVDQLTDEWSKNEWFGGVDPTTISPDNVVTQKTIASQLPVYGSLKAKTRVYTQSDTGIVINVSDLGYSNAVITAYRIKEGGDLSSLQPPEVSSQVGHSIENGTLIIKDSKATPSTVTLYSIDLNNDIVDPGVDPDTDTTPVTPTNGTTYSKTITSTGNAVQYGITSFLPDGFTFTTGKKYVLSISGIPSSAEVRTSGNWVLSLWNYYDVSSVVTNYHYDYGSSNVLEILNDSGSVGNFLVIAYSTFTVTCTIAEV